MGPRATAREAGFLPRAEALRGLAALSVLAYHSASQVYDLIATGLAPVVVFFVLSGFVLSKALDRNRVISTFLRHRAFRLLPAAALTVLLMSALYWQFGFYTGYLPSYDPVNILLNALLLRSDINGPMWSLTVEAAAIPLILICHRLFHAFGYPPLAILTTFLFALSFWGAYVHLLGGVTNLAPLYSFVFGMMAHFYRSSRDLKEQRFSQAIELGALFLIVFAGCRKQTGYTIFAETVSATALLIFTASTTGSTIFGRVLDMGFVRFLGRISYSFYLLHLLGLSIALRVLPQMTSLSYAVSLFVVSAGATIPMAWVMWRFVEVPFIQFGRRSRATKYESAYSQ